MKTVDPIIDKKDVRTIKDMMMADGKTRIALLFYAGVFTGLRISDLIRLKYEDFRKSVVFVTEKKTGKERRIKWQPQLKELFNEIDDGKKTGCVFTSDSNRAKGNLWSYVYTGNVIKAYCELAGLEGRFNNHTLRKTFAYMLYINSGKDLVLVQKALNHSSVVTTRRYLGNYAIETFQAIDSLAF